MSSIESGIDAALKLWKDGMSGRVALNAMRQALADADDELVRDLYVAFTYLPTPEDPSAEPAFQRVLAIDRAHDGKLRRLAPDCLPLAFAMATAYECEGDFASAIEILEMRSHIAPEEFHTLERLGAYYIAVERWEDAALYLDRALAVKPSSITALANKAYVQSRRG